MIIEISKRLGVFAALCAIFFAYCIFRICGLDKKLRYQGEKQHTWGEEFAEFLLCLQKTLRGDLELA